MLSQTQITVNNFHPTPNFDSKINIFMVLKLKYFSYIFSIIKLGKQFFLWLNKENLCMYENNKWNCRNIFWFEKKSCRCLGGNLGLEERERKCLRIVKVHF